MLAPCQSCTETPAARLHKALAAPWRVPKASSLPIRSGSCGSKSCQSLHFHWALFGSHGLPFMGPCRNSLFSIDLTNENPHPFYLTSFRRECPLRSHLPAAGVLTPSGWQQPEGNGGNFNLPQSHLTPRNESSLACCTLLYQSARLRLRIALAHL